MTTEQTKKVKDAIAECDRYIAKEEARSLDLRPVEIQKRLDWYKEHREKLQRSLDSGRVSLISSVFAGNKNILY